VPKLSVLLAACCKQASKVDGGSKDVRGRNFHKELDFDRKELLKVLKLINFRFENIYCIWHVGKMER